MKTDELRGYDMIDRDGYRPNVGIVLCNGRNEVFWGKRVREHSWQFPQGGIKPGETPEIAMYRELHEEVGLDAAAREDPRTHARLAALRRAGPVDQARLARQLPRPEADLVSACGSSGRDCDVCLRASEKPEFDAWRWSDYWVPMESVIDFKRDVYQKALSELSRYLRRRADASLRARAARARRERADPRLKISDVHSQGEGTVLQRLHTAAFHAAAGRARATRSRRRSCPNA